MKEETAEPFHRTDAVETPAAWATEKAEQLLARRNARFTLYRQQDPTFRQDEVDWLAAALLAAEQRGAEKAAKISREVIGKLLT